MTDHAQMSPSAHCGVSKMKLRCPDCGKDDCITAEFYSPVWSNDLQEWCGGDEITGPYICQHCLFEAKYVDPFIWKDEVNDG
jgi:hypothetical protein